RYGDPLPDGAVARLGTLRSVPTGGMIAGAGKPLPSLEGHRLAPVVRFAVKSRNVLLSHDKENAILWDCRSWTSTGALPRPRAVSSQSWFEVRNPDLSTAVSMEKELYAKQDDNGIELRDMKTGRLIRLVQDSAGLGYPAYFSEAGNRLATQD